MLQLVALLADNLPALLCVFFFFFLLWHAPLGLHSSKHRRQSPEWTIVNYTDCFIQGEVIGFQVLLDSLHPHSTRASCWFPLQFFKREAGKIFVASFSSGICTMWPNGVCIKYIQILNTYTEFCPSCIHVIDVCWTAYWVQAWWRHAWTFCWGSSFVISCYTHSSFCVEEEAKLWFCWNFSFLYFILKHTCYTSCQELREMKPPYQLPDHRDIFPVIYLSFIVFNTFYRYLILLVKNISKFKLLFLHFLCTFHTFLSMYFILYSCRAKELFTIYVNLPTD